MSGYVSSCEHGKGRGSADRQFVYVNNRPVDFSKVSNIFLSLHYKKIYFKRIGIIFKVTKLVNETYKVFNKSQYPVLVLNIHAGESRLKILYAD